MREKGYLAVRHSKGRRVFGAISALLAVLLATAAGEGMAESPSEDRTPSRAARQTRPNIILIMTDDQRANTLWTMPRTRRLLVRKGVKFQNGFVSNSLCCPSRASTLTGQYSHSTGVYTNYMPFGGFRAFKDKSTVATWLNRAGYRTALIGKYFNQYKNYRYVAPGWDEWHVFSSRPGNGGGFYSYKLSVNGEEKGFGHRPRHYSTDVLARRALRFVRSSDKPFFLNFTPFAPHGDVPAPRHEGMFENKNPPIRPSYDEEDVSDKPEWVRELRKIGDVHLRLRNLETLVAVDEAIGKLVRLLRKQGELRNTFIVFTSDNGKGWGEHRWSDKSDPYRGSTQVPFVVRYDRWVQGNRVDAKHLVLNMDLAPTFADLANVGLPIDADGRSLEPVLRRNARNWREDFLLEHLEDKRDVPSYCGIRSLKWLYVAYDTGEEELYNLTKDPYELENLANNLDHASTVSNLRDRVKKLCSPAPPGYEFPSGPL